MLDYAGMKIVALSINADGASKRAVLSAGAETLLSKGAATDVLYRAIRQAATGPQSV